MVLSWIIRNLWFWPYRNMMFFENLSCGWLVKKRWPVNGSLLLAQLFCHRDFLCCRGSARPPRLLLGASRRAQPLLWRQKDPKPLTLRLASWGRMDANLRRAGQLAPLKQGLPTDESVPPLGQTAGVGTWEMNSSGSQMKRGRNNIFCMIRFPSPQRVRKVSFLPISPKGTP